MFKYFLVISFVAVIFTIIDKKNSINKKWRVSEKNLIILATLGGAFAMYFTMRIIRHKTLHTKFMIGLPIIIILQIVLLAVYASNYNIF
ncbi:MAG: DUF1294 domain-containing protein [Clostridia bacterium]|nr:DUF1294 domain-containing protein [Clostridia bacterium]